MCIGKNAKEAVNEKSGPWMFTNNIYSAIKKGKLIEVAK
jgi:hypothetical protein